MTTSDADDMAYGWFTCIWIYFAAQAVIGIILFEYSWAATSRYRDAQADRDNSYPTANRPDAKDWARWKFYPRAMFMMPSRFLLLVVDLLIMTILAKIFCIGHDFKKGPLGGCRKKIVYFIVKWFAQGLLTVGGISIKI